MFESSSAVCQYFSCISSDLKMYWISLTWLIAVFIPCVLRDHLMNTQRSFMKDTKLLWKQALFQLWDSKHLDDSCSSLVWFKPPHTHTHPPTHSLIYNTTPKKLKEEKKNWIMLALQTTCSQSKHIYGCRSSTEYKYALCLLGCLGWIHL